MFSSSNTNKSIAEPILMVDLLRDIHSTLMIIASYSVPQLFDDVPQFYNDEESEAESNYRSRTVKFFFTAGFNTFGSDKAKVIADKILYFPHSMVRALQFLKNYQTEFATAKSKMTAEDLTHFNKEFVEHEQICAILKPLFADLDTKVYLYFHNLGCDNLEILAYDALESFNKSSTELPTLFSICKEVFPGIIKQRHQLQLKDFTDEEIKCKRVRRD